MFQSPKTRSTRTEQLLCALADREWHRTSELAKAIGHTFAGAVFTLRRRGYDIEQRPHPKKERQHEYRLVGRPVRRGVR